MDVKLKEYIPHSSFRKGRLTLEFSKYDNDDPIINCLGRVACKRIPVYAFHPDTINIIKVNEEQGYHDSIAFNHDMMRARLKHLPTMNIDPNIDYLHEKYWVDVDYLDKNRNIHEKEADIEFYVHIKNGSSIDDLDSIVNVTTNNLDIHINGKKIDPNELFDKEYPFLLISLKPKEAFEVSMKAVLGIGFQDMIFDSGSNYYLNMEDKKDATFLTIEATSRFDEFILFERSLNYFIKRVENLTFEIEKLYKSSIVDKKFTILLKNEDHTMAEAMNYELQSHKDIMFSSCRKPNNLINEINIDIQVFKKDKMMPAIKESMDNLIDKVKNIQKKFNKIDKPKPRKTIDPSKIKYEKKSKFKTEKLKS